MRKKGRKSRKREIKLFFEKEKRLKNYPRYANQVADFFIKEYYVPTYSNKRKIIKNAN